MMRTTRTRFGGVLGVALAGLVLAGWVGAASRPAGATDDMGEARAAGEALAGADGIAIPTAAAATQLLGIEAERTEIGTVLRLRADGEIADARTMLLESPSRLVLDLPGLRAGAGAKRVDIDSEHAARVRIGQHDRMLRVVVDGGSAPQPFDGFVVLPQPDGLAVGLGPEAARLVAPWTPVAAVPFEGTPEPAEAVTLAAGEALVSAAADPMPQEMAQEPLLPEPAPVAAEPAPAMPEAPAAPESSVAASAGSIAETPMAEIAIEPAAEIAEAPVAEIAMAPPAEIAVAPVAEIAVAPTADLAGTPPAVSAGMALTESAGIESAPPAALGAAELQAPIAAASSTTAATPTPEGIVRVHGVQYDAQPDRDRLVIVQEGRASHSLLRPDAETLVVSLQGAELDPGANIRVTPQEPGPISLVTAVQMPGVTVPEVRIAIARAPGAEPTLSEQGEFLILDFPRSAAAAPRPAASADPEIAPRVVHAAMQAQKTAPPASAAQPPAQAGAAGGTEMLKEGGLVGGKAYTGRRISLDFKDVEIADVLRLIAEVSDLNVIAGDEVKGQVTIRLTDVPWDQALDVILLTKGLGFVLVGNVLRIAPQDVLKTEEAARLEERRAKEKLEDLVVKLHPVNYANVTEIEGMVKKLLTSRGSVNVDKRTNTLILKDIPSVVEEAVALTKAIDSPTPQVLIDSKIVEAKLDFLRDIGAQWGLGSNPEDADGDFSDDFTVGDTTILTRGTSTFPFQQANNVVVQNPITSTANGILNLGGYILDDRFNLSLRLAAAENEGEGKVISSPRVVTLDNREAKIEQGVSIPFQTFENGDAQLEFIDAVLSLLVTPHITADRSIIMKITVTRNAPDPSVPTPTGSPAIAKNEARTETLVKNGQTLVLGGIYTIDRSESETRIPFLYRVPIIGFAFKENKITDKRRELLIFVTPRIVETSTAQN